MGMKWAYERKVDKKTHTDIFISTFHLEIWDICNINVYNIISEMLYFQVHFFLKVHKL